MRITLFVLALSAAAACSKSEPAQQAPAAKTEPAPAPAHPPATGKDPQKARELIAQGAVVLDVRTTDEFSDAHLPSATNIPVDDVGSRLADVEALVKGDKSKPIVVYCAKGGRAARAKTTLEGAGYTNVTNGGGYDDLK